MSGVLVVILIVVFVIVAALLVGLVLVQDEGGAGAGGIFGGSSASAFGSRSGNVLTKTTYILGGTFFVVCFAIAVLFSVSHKNSDLSEGARLAEQAAAEGSLEVLDQQQVEEAENWFKGEEKESTASSSEVPVAPEAVVAE